MKTSWLIFMIFTYIAIFYFAGVAEYANLMNALTMHNLQALAQPTGTNWFLQGVSQINALWDFFVNLIKMLFLWNGTLWTGYWYYFYLFFCLPLCVGIVISLVFILRGVHSS